MNLQPGTLHLEYNLLFMNITDIKSRIAVRGNSTAYHKYIDDITPKIIL